MNNTEKEKKRNIGTCGKKAKKKKRKKDMSRSTQIFENVYQTYICPSFVKQMVERKRVVYKRCKDKQN